MPVSPPFSLETLEAILKNTRLSDITVLFQQSKEGLVGAMAVKGLPNDQFTVFIRLADDYPKTFVILGNVDRKIPRQKFIQALYACNDVNWGGAYGGRVTVRHNTGETEAEITYLCFLMFHEGYTTEIIKLKTEGVLTEIGGFFINLSQKHHLF
jgi:hypothetical protein